MFATIAVYHSFVWSTCRDLSYDALYTVSVVQQSPSSVQSQAKQLWIWRIYSQTMPTNSKKSAQKYVRNQECDIKSEISRNCYIFTVRRYALYGLSYRNSVCLSVYLSVRPSVTLVHCVHMALPTIMISSPYGSPIILVSGISRSSQNSKGVTPSEGIEWGWGGYELAIFDQ